MKTESQELLEKILNKPISIHESVGIAQSLCLIYLAGEEYQEWEKEIKQLAKIHYEFLKNLK